MDWSIRLEKEEEQLELQWYENYHYLDLKDIINNHLCCKDVFEAGKELADDNFGGIFTAVGGTYTDPLTTFREFSWGAKVITVFC